MPITYIINSALDFILETWDGPVSAAELETYWTAYLSDPKVLECRRTLVDLRNGKPLFMGAELDHLIQKIVLPVLKGRGWRSALLVERPLQHGVSRQYNVFAEKYSQDSIFYEYQAALAWLLLRHPD